MEKIEQVKLMPTIAGKGYKIVIETETSTQWVYASASQLDKMMSGNAKACTFSQWADNETVKVEVAKEQSDDLQVAKEAAEQAMPACASQVKTTYTDMNGNCFATREEAKQSNLEVHGVS